MPSSVHPAVRTRLARSLRRHWYPLALAGAALVTFGCGLAGFAWQPDDRPRGAADLDRAANVVLPTADQVPAPTARPAPVAGAARDATPPDPAPAAESERDLTIYLFKTFQLFLLGSGAEPPSNPFLVAARISAIALFLLVSGGVILSVTRETAWVPRRLLRRRHYVICGLGQIGVQLLDDFARRGQARQVVVVEPDENSPWVRHARAIGADVIQGDATRRDTLEEARAAAAAAVFAVTGDDGANLEIAAELENMVRARPFVPPRRFMRLPACSDRAPRNCELCGCDLLIRSLRLVVPRRQAPQIRAHVLDVHLATTFQRHMPQMSRQCDLHVFNVLRNSATSVITRRLWSVAPRTPREVSHFVILGFGPMGETLAVQLAQLAHFPNRKRARFTIADHQIEPLARQFLGRFPRFTAWSDRRLGVARFSVATDAWNGPQDPLPQELAAGGPPAIEYVANAQFCELLPEACDERFVHALTNDLRMPDVKPAIFVCGRHDRENFSLAVQLKDRLACLGSPDVPIFVWLPRQPALAAVTEQGIVPFGDCQSTAGLLEIENPQRDFFARAIHKDYERRAAAEAATKGEHRPAKTWKSESEWPRESNRQAADHLVFKLAALGYRLRRRRPDEPARSAVFTAPTKDEERLLAEMEHNRWMAERLLAGWRYAANTNRDRKQHSLLVPCEELTPKQLSIDLDQIHAALKAAEEGEYVLERLEGDSSGR